jgi:deoxyribonuclease V
MRVQDLHRWDISPSEARKIQIELRRKLKIETLDLQKITYVAGADVSFDKGSDSVYASLVVLSYPELSLVEQIMVQKRTAFPYIPGLLVFREGPALLDAFRKLSIEPDVIIFDGHGLAHPRRLGIAAHLGIILDKPSIGCAKTVLVGHFKEPALEKGSVSPLLDEKEEIGKALRTKDGVAPLFISIGHKVDLTSACQLILRCTPSYRSPEPLRWAHILANKARSSQNEQQLSFDSFT